MPYSKHLHNSLDKISQQHIVLTDKFKEFANFIKHCIETPSVANNNITVSLQHLDKGVFTTVFADRTTSFVFSTALTSTGSLVGNVKCFIKKEFPEPKQVHIGEFTFNEDGHTSLKLPNEDSKINMNNDFGTLHIILHFIHEGLRT
ncbi:MAG: hypothetical protein HOP23_05965 [Methylococcaceae bacterium]|nr:hypothetical protein [Methylococcaceae bacterium]